MTTEEKLKEMTDEVERLRKIIAALDIVLKHRADEIRRSRVVREEGGM